MRYFLFQLQKNITFNALVVKIPFGILQMAFPSITIRKKFNKNNEKSSEYIFCLIKVE